MPRPPWSIPTTLPAAPCWRPASWRTGSSEPAREDAGACQQELADAGAPRQMHAANTPIMSWLPWPVNPARCEWAIAPQGPSHTLDTQTGLSLALPRTPVVEPRPEAGARHERRLEPVGCTPSLRKSSPSPGPRFLIFLLFGYSGYPWASWCTRRGWIWRSIRQKSSIFPSV